MENGNIMIRWKEMIFGGIKIRFSMNNSKFETFEKCSILFKFKAGDPPQAD